MRRHLLPLVSLAALVPPAVAGEAVVYLGPPSGPGQVATLEEAGDVLPQPVPGLDGVTLLSIDFPGRSQLSEFLPQRPRHRADVPGASRLVLPGGGSLYRFSRDEGAQGLAFGLFLVEPTGGARIVWERPGAGAGQSEDPLLERVAVSPSGDALLVATTLAAGGELLEIDVATGQVEDRTGALAPLDLDGRGLALSATWGTAVAASGVVRFDRAPGAVATAVAFSGGPAPTFFSREVVTSNTGAFAATTAGSSATALEAWVYGASGPALRASSGEALLSGAGSLPDALGGPYLAVSDDGAMCGWRVEQATSREVFLARVQATPVQPPVQVTDSPDFTDTGTEIGVLGFFQPGRLILGWGEALDPLDPSLMENGDVFSVGLDAGGAPVIENLSLTSGIAQAPFDVLGTLNVTRLALLPGAAKLLVMDEDSGGGGNLLAVDLLAGGGAQVLIPGVREVQALDVIGSRALVILQRDTAQRPSEMWSLPTDLSTPPVLVASAPETDEPVRWAGRADGRALVVVPDGVTTAERLWRLNLVNGSSRLFSSRMLRYGTTLDFGPVGTPLFSVGVPGLLQTFVGWPFGMAAPYRLLPMRLQGFLLPAR